jgi:hypothetical protein
MPKNLIKRLFPLLILINVSHFSFSQKSDSTKGPSHFGGTGTVTSKGISMVPNLSLGKPAKRAYQEYQHDFGKSEFFKYQTFRTVLHEA